MAIKVDDHRWQRQVRLKMSDYGEKTNGFYQNNMIFGCVLRERTQRFLYRNGELTECNGGEVCDDLENRWEVCCI